MRNVIHVVSIYLFCCLFIGCNTNESTQDNFSLAEVSTNDVNTITATSARISVIVVSNGGDEITSCGVCWNTSPAPTIDNNFTNNGSGIGNYIISITGLMPNTTYYIRSYVTNSLGTAYGNEISFTTLQEDGNNPPTGDPTISFAQSTQTLGNTMPFGLAIADVDLDGDNDIFITNLNGASRLWINNGSGTFSLHSQLFASGSAAHDVDMADLNGDSYPDIFLANHQSANEIYFNNGNGSFSLGEQNIGGTNEYSQTIQLADVDLDGDKDAYIYNSNAPNRIWLNDGNGFFTMINVDYGGSNSNKQVLADFNNDFAPDLYINMRNGTAQIWLNDGVGNFTNTGQALSGGENISCNDIDADGDIDIVVANFGEVIIWFNQNNTGTFTGGIGLGEGAFKCKLFDADLDGDFDLVTTHLDDGNKLWINDGTGSFSSLGTIFGTLPSHCLECGKLDDDEYYDVVLGIEVNYGGNLIFLNETTP